MAEAGSIQAVQGGRCAGEAEASPLIDSTDERFTRRVALRRYRPDFFDPLQPEPNPDLQNHPTRRVDLLDHPRTWVNAIVYPDGEGEASFCHIGLPSSRPRKKATAEEIARKASARAKRKIEQLVRANQMSMLWTVTKRGGWDTYREAQEFWENFVAEVRRSYASFEPLAVPELHTGKNGIRGGNFGKWHIHFAVNGYFRVEPLRAVVWKLLGAGQGNVDVQPPRDGRPSVGGVSRYLSKYIAKSFTELDRPPGQHRYWVTRAIVKKLSECRQRMVFFRGTVQDHQKAIEAWLIMATGKKVVSRWISPEYDQGIFRTWGVYNERTGSQAGTSP